MTLTTDTPAAPGGRTRWETAQYAADRGKTAAMAIGQQLLARHIATCATEDMEILGLREMPEPKPYMIPVTKGTDEERKARVDAFAARYGVRAYADEAISQYRAVLGFGPVSMVVYMLTDADLTARIAARRAAIQAAADETLAVTQPGSAA